MGSYTINILSTDDRRQIQASTLIVSRRFIANGQAINIQAGRGHISGKEPIVMGIVQTLNHRIGIKKIVNAANNAKNSILIYIGKPKFEVVFRKNGK